MDYKHLPLNKEISVIAGSYWISEEARIPYRGREVLAVVAETSTIVTCGEDGCGVQIPAVRFVSVPGYVNRWKYREDDGLPLSDIDPITEAKEREEIERTVSELYEPDRVDFLE